MKIWSVSDVQDGECYRLLLCQNASGRRYFKLDLVRDGDVLPDENQVLATQIVPIHLLKKRDLMEIASNILLSGGEEFFVDSHGIWLTKSEAEQMRTATNYERINWATTAPPYFPDR